MRKIHGTKPTNTITKLYLSICACILTIGLSACSADKTGENASVEANNLETTEVSDEFELLEIPNTSLRTIQINEIDLEIDLEMPNQTWFNANQMTTLFENPIVMRELPDYDI